MASLGTDFIIADITHKVLNYRFLSYDRWSFPWCKNICRYFTVQAVSADHISGFLHKLSLPAKSKESVFLELSFTTLKNVGFIR